MEGSRLTVVIALLANTGVAVLKLVAGLLSGSGALLSEAAHSAGDTSTQILLLTAVKRSERPADTKHPFGYGKERYFWSLLAAFGILISGAVFSLYQGVHTIISPHEESTYVWVNYVVLAIAFVMEGVSLVQATRQVRKEAEEHDLSLAGELRGTDDPTPRAVFTEDLAAVIGIVLAAAGVALHQLTGSAVWDGIASILIGVLLAVVAVLLGKVCKGLLIGRQADQRLVRAVWEHIEKQPEVDDLVDVQTMLTGTDKVLVCARVDFIDTYSAGDVEQACIRVDNELRELFHDVDEVFIQPVPRTDADLRQRVLQRYGRVLTD